MIYEALFYYTGVYGMRAQLAATENEWWSTAQLGKKMKRNAEMLVKKDPGSSTKHTIFWDRLIILRTRFHRISNFYELSCFFPAAIENKGRNN